MDAPKNAKADGSELLSIPIPEELTEDASKRLRATEESYMKVPQILATLSPEANIKVFEGLPNPIFREQFNDEIANNQTALRHGFHFYLPETNPRGELAQELNKILQDRLSFGPSTLGWGCGGFHPDYSVVYRYGNDEVEFQICLTCHEIRVFSGEIVAYCDQSVEAYRHLKQIYKGINQKCPPPPELPASVEQTGQQD